MLGDVFNNTVKFNTNIEGGKKIVDNYFMITRGQV